MTERIDQPGKNRRAFLKEAAAYGGALALGNYASKLQAAATDWSKQIGIQLSVVRDETAKGMEPALAKLAEIGYKVIEPVGFSGLDAKDYRAMLDRHGLIASHIDQGFSTGPDMEKDLESCQILGCKYVEPAGAGGGRRGAGPPGAGGGGRGGGRGPIVPDTEESTKRTAAAYNSYGQAARKFGLKVIYHHHVEHFEVLAGTKTTFFDLFLSETDPEMVSMELDVGYVALVGRNVPETIRQYAGRFPVWDVRDYVGIKSADANPAAATPAQRRPYGYAVPVGLGEVDYKTAFANAEAAGLKYFGVVQENSTTWGDSMAAARISWQNLNKLLTAE